MKFSLIALLSLSVLICPAQDQWRKAIATDLEGKNIALEVLDEDWQYNPHYFKYRLDSNARPALLRINELQSLRIDDQVKFVRAIVQVEQSSDRHGHLSPVHSPEFRLDTVFLEILLEGPYSLLRLNTVRNERFYLQDPQGEFHLLVYKKYSPSGMQIGENLAYRNQLKELLKEAQIEAAHFKNLSYHPKALQGILLKFYSATTSNYLAFQREQRKKAIFLSLNLGFNLQNLKASNLNGISPLETESSSGFSLNYSISLGYRLPFNNNRWLLCLEPGYREFNQFLEEKQSYGLNGEIIYQHELKYQSLEIPILLRHYWFRNAKEKFFVNAGLFVDLPLNGELQREDQAKAVSLSNNYSPILGFGYQYQKFSCELRLNYFRNLTANYVSWDTNYAGLQLILSQNIL